MDRATGKELSHPVNVEQLVVVLDRHIIDLQSDNNAVVEMDPTMDSPVLYPSSSLIPSDLVQVSYQFENICTTCLATLQQHQLYVSTFMISIRQLEKS